MLGGSTAPDRRDRRRLGQVRRSLGCGSGAARNSRRSSQDLRNGGCMGRMPFEITHRWHNPKATQCLRVPDKDS